MLQQVKIVDVSMNVDVVLIIMVIINFRVIETRKNMSQKWNVYNAKHDKGKNIEKNVSKNYENVWKLQNQQFKVLSLILKRLYVQKIVNKPTIQPVCV